MIGQILLNSLTDEQKEDLDSLIIQLICLPFVLVFFILWYFLAPDKGGYKYVTKPLFHMSLLIGISLFTIYISYIYSFIIAVKLGVYFIAFISLCIYLVLCIRSNTHSKIFIMGGAIGILLSLLCFSVPIVALTRDLKSAEQFFMPIEHRMYTFKTYDGKEHTVFTSRYFKPHFINQAQVKSKTKQKVRSHNPVSISRKSYPFKVVPINLYGHNFKVRIMNIKPVYQSQMLLPTGNYKLELSCDICKTTYTWVKHESNVTHAVHVVKKG